MRRIISTESTAEALGSDERCGAPDPSYRHAMPVLGPIESYRRPCSSGVGCAKITHMNRTVATSNSVNVSTARTIDPRQTASQWPHRYRAALETNTLLAPGSRTWTLVSAVAVIAHRQRPPTSSAPSMMAGCTISMTFQQSKPHSSWLPCDFSRACARRGVGHGRVIAKVWLGRHLDRVTRAPEKAARVMDLTLRGAPA